MASVVVRNKVVPQWVRVGPPRRSDAPDHIGNQYVNVVKFVVAVAIVFLFLVALVVVPWREYLTHNNLLFCRRVFGIQYCRRRQSKWIKMSTNRGRWRCMDMMAKRQT